MTAKTSITFLIWTESPGGIEKTLMYYPKNLKEYEYNIFVLRPRQSDVEMFDDQYFKNKTYGSLNNKTIYTTLYQYCVKNKDSIFHVLNAGPAILLILKMAGCKKIIYHIHGTVYWKKRYKKTPTRMLWKMALSNNVKIIANSEYSKSMFLKRANKNYPIEVVYNPFEIPQQKMIHKADSIKGLSVYYVGRLVKGKNLFLWLEIASQLSKKFTNINFHFYGKGNLEIELKEYAEKLGLGNQVHFHGFLKNIELAYQSHDILLFLSEYESFGNVVVESIITGTPVIAKPIPSIKEIFVDFPVFLLKDDENYTQQIIEKLNDFNQLRNKTEEARKTFEDRFSMEYHIQKIKQLYEQY